MESYLLTAFRETHVCSMLFVNFLCSMWTGKWDGSTIYGLSPRNLTKDACQSYYHKNKIFNNKFIKRRVRILHWKLWNIFGRNKKSK